MTAIKNIVLIGSGNVATHLADAFLASDFNILQVYSPNPKNAAILAQKAGCPSTNNLADILPDADLYIIAIKDDAISALNQNLRISGNAIFVHTSGSAALASIKNISANTGVFYPLQTFTKNRPVNFKEIPICLEASNPETMDALQFAAHKLSQRVYEIDSPTRKNLHLAAVFANNFSNYLLGVSGEIIGDALPFNILEPLVAETIKKAFEIGPGNAQTGPALRGDQNTINSHLDLLRDNPTARELYSIFSTLIIEKYKEKF